MPVSYAPDQSPLSVKNRSVRNDSVTWQIRTWWGCAVLGIWEEMERMQKGKISSPEKPHTLHHLSPESKVAEVGCELHQSPREGL